MSKTLLILISAFFLGFAACSESSENPDVDGDWEYLEIEKTIDGDKFDTEIPEILEEAELEEVEVHFQDPSLIEYEFKEKFNNSGLAINGSVVDQTGKALSGVTITVLPLTITVDEKEENNKVLDTKTSKTDSSGKYNFSGLPRINRLIEVSADGYYSFVMAVNLFLPLTSNSINLDPVILTKTDDTTVRFLFGGDMSFGRRFIDPTDTTPHNEAYKDHPEAYIKASDPEPGTKAVMSYVQPYFPIVDYPIANLETVVTSKPETPHTDKAYVYFTFPESLPALTWLGLDYVSLGNNHIYDYLEKGITDTIAHLNKAKINHSGAGSISEDAFKPFRKTIKGSPYSFLSATSVAGSQHEVNYVASSKKGGAADLRKSNTFKSAIEKELNEDQIPIPQLHTGKEYTFEPSEYAWKSMHAAADAGASLVVCHHPHVAQGFEFYNGSFIIHNLGNLFFEQQRLETFLSIIAIVDMDGATMKQASAIPLYIEDYRTKPLTGASGSRLLRKLGEFSENALAYQYLDRIIVTNDESTYKTKDIQKEATIIVAPDGVAVIDLQEYAASDYSLKNISLDLSEAKAYIGRDILTYGDFEDIDVDDDQMELARWNVNNKSRVQCTHNPYRGAAAVCLLRTENNTQDVVAAFKNRIRVWGDALNEPNKQITFFGYARGVNAGPSKIVARYYASEGPLIFGEEVAFEKEAGTYDWHSFKQDLTLPEDATDLDVGSFLNARALRLFLRHSKPEQSYGLVSFDELALISWEEEIDLTGKTELKTPHARDYVRIEGKPGAYTVKLTFRKYRPSIISE